MKAYWLSVAFFLAGCASTVDATSASSENALADDSVCTAQNSAFDMQLAKIIPAATPYDAVMETITPDCGAAFHTAGPSHLEATRLVRIGSMTKSFVAVVVLQLVAEGKVDLDTRLDAYLPNTNAAFAPATIRQLLQHTSGIASYTDSDAFWTALNATPKKSLDARRALALAAAEAPTGAPGAGWSYSNTNYILLGELVEALDQRPIATAIRARILTPNKLTETFFDGEEPLGGALAPGLDANGNDVTTEYDPSWAWSAGAIVASARDMAQFVELLGSGALLSPAMQTELTKSVPIAAEPGLNYGLGVFMADASITGGLGPAIGHGGDIMGYHSWGMYFPDKKTTLAGTVDSETGAGNDILVAGITALVAPSP